MLSLENSTKCLKRIYHKFYTVSFREKETEFSTSFYKAAAAKSLQLCPTLGNPIDGSPPGSPVPGILQARTLEWVAISFYKASVTLIPKIKTLKTSRT